MRRRDLGSVALKTLGVYWLVQVVFYVEQAAVLPFANLPRAAWLDWRLELAAILLHAIVLGAVGYLLTFRTTLVMRWIGIEEADVEEPGKPERVNDIEALAIALLGAYFVVPAIASAAPMAVRLWSLRLPTDHMAREGYVAEMWPHLVGDLVQIAAGLVLIIGRNGLARLWRLSRPMANQG